MSKYLHFFLLFLSTSLSAQITGTQKIPANALPGTDFMVETTINKGSSKDFMKFFQEIPDGLVATEMESQGGAFTFADGGAKIIWINPPTEETFTVKYKVTVNGGVSGTKNLPAKISYLMNNERQIFNFPATSIIIGTPTPVAKALPKTNPTPTTTPVKAPVGETVPLGSTTTSTPATTTSAPAKTTQPPVAKETPVSTQPTTFAKVPTSALPAASGKTYKVQIGAFSAKPKIDGVTEVSTLVLENGITKYFSGNFSTYEDALKRKKEMVEKGFQGAFIVAFENGKIVK